MAKTLFLLVSALLALAAAVPEHTECRCDAATPSPVCGSDGVTYPSSCHLQCADKAAEGSALTQVSHGPCSDLALVAAGSADAAERLRSPSRARRGAAQENEKNAACIQGCAVELLVGCISCGSNCPDTCQETNKATLKCICRCRTTGLFGIDAPSWRAKLTGRGEDDFGRIPCAAAERDRYAASGCKEVACATESLAKLCSACNY
ncbi:hypothetical protein ONE63_005202 [Megalurothrips usitatus]|uniref:Kazal-like domain-containing protein n=1 Tax=Megalurothrips usitatus TaxID=439358 RepID=A0AAV7XY42_9NEOP|nr:hypothetical protein ONE63_005202 [Megalurothrips usitatus]